MAEKDLKTYERMKNIMLKLPGRGKKRESFSFFAPYKNLINIVGTKKLVVKETVSGSYNKLPDSMFSSEKKKSGLIKIRNLEKSFGKHLVLQNINLEIQPGKIFGVIGESGSGKTTLLRLIIGYYKLTKGEITFDGNNIVKDSEFVKNNFGFATQDNSFYKDLTVEENLRFFGELYGLEKNYLNETIDRILKLVELIDVRKRLARQLSGGMKRRLDLACALIHDPSVLILDEPTEDLDPRLREQLLNLIKNINNHGTTVIFTSHLLEEIEYLCDKVAVLSKGTIIKVGSPNELREAYKKGEEIHIVLENAKNYSLYAKKLRGLQLNIDGNKMVVYVPEKQNSVTILKKILSWVSKDGQKVVLADIRKPNLTEVFSNLIKDGKKRR